MEVAISNGNIGAVSFHGQAVVAIIYSPVVEADVGRADRIRAIGIRYSLGDQTLVEADNTSDGKESETYSWRHYFRCC